MIIKEDFFKAEFINEAEFERILNYDTEMLKIWSKRIVNHYWGKDFNVNAVFEELKLEDESVTYGFFRFNPMIQDDPRTMQLAVSNRLVKHNYYNPKMVEQILKHELTHWHIFTTQGYFFCRDGDPVFESELRRINAISQFDIISGLVKVIVHRPKKKQNQ